MNAGQIIADQIGRKAFFMMGAKELIASDKSLRFKIMRNEFKVTHVLVTLDPSDTYTVAFLTGRKVKGVPEFKEVSSVSDVYVDVLHHVIEKGTGLYLSL